MSRDSLCFLPATELVRIIRKRKVSATEVMQVHLDQIARLNPKINAIVTMDPEQALRQAKEVDAAVARGEARGALAGLPIGVKDLLLTKGMRTTYGSVIYKDLVPDQDALLVERERAAGGIILGKTNTPEFGAGGQTFNTVFGTTLNPYDLDRTCGGSSGGSAAALACGMLPLADGTDFGGSLRFPAAYCNVVGFRPSPGRVPTYPTKLGWYTLVVQGPMARTVGDVALFLSAIAGPDPRSPISIQEPASVFARPLERDLNGVRIAWSRNLGRYPVEPVVTEVLDRQRRVFEDLGCRVEDADPDMTDADETFDVLRAWRYSIEREYEYTHHRDQLKKTVVWNTEQGMKLDGFRVARAEANRTALYHRVREFMETYEFIVTPVAPVPPYPVKWEYIAEINGQKLKNYYEFAGLLYAFSNVGVPAISVPAGFTADGLPIGMQIVGRPNRDFDVLQLAHAFEQETQFWKRAPAIALGHDQ
ncbi:MAG TPA: amidase [Methylomirabilota bacterium]|nr:amidase [Methylomirabilota bacterium]